MSGTDLKDKLHVICREIGYIERNFCHLCLFIAQKIQLSGIRVYFFFVLSH